VTGIEVDLPAIAHLWARRRISDLEDQYRLAPAGQKGALEQEIVTVSTAYGVLCRFTAFVVVDDAQTVVSTADRQTIVQPVELPHLWASAFVDSRREAATLRMESRASFADLAPLDELPDLRSLGLPRSRPVATRSGRTAPASSTPNAGDLVALDLQSHMEKLLELLREAHHNRTTRDYHEMVDHLERVMAAMPAAPDHHGLTELRSLLERLRDCLRATVAATAELAGLATELARIWADVSKNSRRFKPFWEHV
jgi:Ca-activated chloride channel family protein